MAMMIRSSKGFANSYEIAEIESRRGRYDLWVAFARLKMALKEIADAKRVVARRVPMTAGPVS